MIYIIYIYKINHKYLHIWDIFMYLYLCICIYISYMLFNHLAVCIICPCVSNTEFILFNFSYLKEIYSFY